MSNNNIDQALAALADALKGIELNSSVDYKAISKKLPQRSLSGDHISGGTIQNFASFGITDNATKTQLTVSNDGVKITNLTVDNISNLSISGTLKTKVLEVDELKADIKFEKDTPIVFSSDNLDGKGILWKGTSGNTKQFVFATNPDRIFVSENIDFARGKSVTINGIKVIDEQELGPTITKSNLRQVGRLNGLLVDGSMSVGQYMFYNNDTNKFGLGIEDPNGAFSVAEDGIEITIGTKDSVRGYIGTHGSNNLDIITDDTERITITSSGNITLGNPRLAPVQVSVHGKLSVKVSTPDPEVDLHVNGSIKFNNRLHKYDRSQPTSGSYNEGDIVWNIEPKMNSYVGWVCIQAGAPGLWAPFGKIGS